MKNMFLQSEVEDPFKEYEKMRPENPMYWDEESQHWIVYSYKYCQELLKNPLIHIPAINSHDNDRLNEYQAQIINHVTRLRNGNEHTIARETAKTLFSKMKPQPLDVVLESLTHQGEIDWVDSVCKKLPICFILGSFSFGDDDIAYIVSSMEDLVKVMMPNKPESSLAKLNEVSKEIYILIKKQLVDSGIYQSEIDTLSTKYKIERSQIVMYVIGNFIGLLIQSFDSCRGVLSNALIQIINRRLITIPNFISKNYLEKMVIETLRFDPVFHNTTRVVSESIEIDGFVIKKGQRILIMLASANRDPLTFDNSEVFDMDRFNNEEHLGFGYAGHDCIAKYFSINMSVETLFHLFRSNRKIELANQKLEYEPRVNARLLKQIIISIT